MLSAQQFHRKGPTGLSSETHRTGSSSVEQLPSRLLQSTSIYSTSIYSRLIQSKLIQSKLIQSRLLRHFRPTLRA
jgi:hypothetical protein